MRLSEDFERGLGTMGGGKGRQMSGAKDMRHRSNIRASDG